MSAANHCFNNSLIVQKILGHFDVLGELQLRLINKKCDEELLHQTRPSFRRVKIEVEDEHLPWIKINGCFVEPRGFFQFLGDRVEVKVEELEVIRIGELDASVAQELHDVILDVLIRDGTLEVFKGMRELCEVACDRCCKHAIQSKEYGPVQFWGLFEFFKEPKHFDKLIVDDQLLWFIEQVSPSANQLAQLELMKKFIHSRISCDHLQIQLYDDIRGSAPLPRELLEEMCKTWKVKSIGVTFQSQERGRYNWDSDGRFPSHFTQLRWNSNHEETRVSTGFLLDYVEVDLEKAPVQFNGVFGKDGSRYPYNFNLTANIRKVFPAKHYYFNGHRMSERTAVDRCLGMIDNNRLCWMLRAAIIGTSASNTSPITFRLWTPDTHREINLSWWLMLKYKKKIKFLFSGSLSKAVFKHFFDGTERIGRSYKTREKETGCLINVEIYMDRNKTDHLKSSQNLFKKCLESLVLLWSVIGPFFGALIGTITRLLFVIYFARLLF